MAQSYGEADGITVQMEGPFSGGESIAKVGSITMYAGSWKGAASPYSQIVATDIVTMNSIVELQPSAAQLEMLYEKGIALLAENNAGTVTVYALGAKPEADLTMQITTREVVAA